MHEEVSRVKNFILALCFIRVILTKSIYTKVILCIFFTKTNLAFTR